MSKTPPPDEYWLQTLSPEDQARVVAEVYTQIIFDENLAAFNRVMTRQADRSDNHWEEWKRAHKALRRSVLKTIQGLVILQKEAEHRDQRLTDQTRIMNDLHERIARAESELERLRMAGIPVTFQVGDSNMSLGTKW